MILTNVMYTDPRKLSLYTFMYLVVTLHKDDVPAPVPVLRTIIRSHSLLSRPCMFFRSLGPSHYVDITISSTRALSPCA